MTKTTIRERPVNLADWQVRALKEGRLSQIRVPVNLPAKFRWYAEEAFNGEETGHVVRRQCGSGPYHISELPCPLGKPGDRLWVREAYCPVDPSGLTTNVTYRADYPRGVEDRHDFGLVQWTSLATMPRQLSRFTMEVTSVRMERLQEISEADARACGAQEMCVLPGDRGSFVQPFAYEWEGKHGSGSWDANPWVWVVGVKNLKGGA